MALFNKTKQVDPPDNLRDSIRIIGYIRKSMDTINSYTSEKHYRYSRRFRIEIEHESSVDILEYKNFELRIDEIGGGTYAVCGIYLDVEKRIISGQFVFVGEKHLSYNEMKEYGQLVCYLVGILRENDIYCNAIEKFKLNLGACAWDNLNKIENPELPRIVVENSFDNYKKIEENDLKYFGFFDSEVG